MKYTRYDFVYFCHMSLANVTVLLLVVVISVTKKIQEW